MTKCTRFTIWGTCYMKLPALQASCVYSRFSNNHTNQPTAQIAARRSVSFLTWQYMPWIGRCWWCHYTRNTKTYSRSIIQQPPPENRTLFSLSDGLNIPERKVIEKRNLKKIQNLLLDCISQRYFTNGAVHTCSVFNFLWRKLLE